MELIEGEDYKVYLVDLPGDLGGAIREDCDGFASIYINNALSPEAKRRVLEHELGHKARGDLYSPGDIHKIEH